ncbi:putative uncharacterized protein DDB_G0279653 [Myzus persicae]|uniref:putative uncharacterized protein DDB_G0279653 n=1 Tax=Myzus persicae TaxID=13164 RepID=UPI000B931D1A|nr:putative uncharacterized protein DDB_G0279653 [Myzus persicae]
MSFSTSASSLTLVVKILMVILLGLSETVFATSSTWEREWSAVVVPITWSPGTANHSRLTAQSKPFRWWNRKATSTHSKSAGMMTEASSHLSSTCHGFSCRDKNRNVENHLDKNRHDQNHQEAKRCGNNHHEKKRCGGKNQQNKPCGENQQQKHCGKNQCEKRCGKNQGEKRCGKNQGEKRCGEKRNDRSRHGTTNCNRKNNRQNNMKNGNKRRQFVVDNKVIININDNRTPSPTLSSDIKTPVEAVQASITPQSVVHRSFSSFYNHWYSDIIIWLSLLAIWMVIIFCIYNVYFISDRYHSIFT